MKFLMISRRARGAKFLIFGLDLFVARVAFQEVQAGMRDGKVIIVFFDDIYPCDSGSSVDNWI